MGEKSIQKLLEQSFSKSSKQEWERTATTELNGYEPFTHLSWKVDDHLEFLPYYVKEDTASLTYLRNFDNPPAKKSFSGNRTCYNLPGEIVTEELAVNKNALQHLANGADGVQFTLKRDIVNLDILLNDILPQYCLLSFHGNIGPGLLNSFEHYLLHKKVTSGIAGHLFWDQLPQKIDPFKFLLGNPAFKPLGIIVHSSNPVTEIAEALVAGVKMIESLRGQTDVGTLIGNIAFSVPLHTQFISDISKLKALRLLWYQIAQSYGWSGFLPGDLHIHSRSEPWMQQQYEPQANMLKSTTSAMAAVLGGADSITISCQDANNFLQARIARNISNILREESHFEKVADPVAGAYAIDVIVDSFARAAWSIFQSTMK
jgi:methylmalonyl-CoA mutase